MKNVVPTDIREYLTPQGRKKLDVYEEGTPVWKDYLESLDAVGVLWRLLWIAWGITAVVLMFWLIPGPWDWVWFLLP